ncbi:hypothetical protein ACHAW6_009615 [Cyclotella cf. meneghiniana]
MLNFKSFVFSVAPIFLTSSPRGSSRSVTAMIVSNSSTSSQQCSDNGKSAVIFLHGLGDTPAGWSSLQRNLPSIRPKLGKDVHYIFPPAPTVSISINGGMQMPGWFDLYDWPIGVNARDDRAGKIAAVEQIEQTVERLEKEEGISPSRMIVGGFSQGGAVALLTAYHRRTQGKVPFAGCVCLSGWLTLKDELVVLEEVANSTPLFWGHGRYDDKVLFEQQEFGVKKLQSHGVHVSHAAYPMGHESDYDELEAMAEFIEKRLFPEE